MDSSRRDFIIRAAALGSIAAIPAIGAPDVRTEAEPKKREIARLRDVRLDGELGARYQAATCNILTRQDRYSLESFRSSASGVPGALWWDWPGDQIGRYLSVLHVASGCGWTPAHGRRAEILDAVLPLQGGAGNFGPEKPDQTNVQFISGNAFALRGLLDAYEDGGDPCALNGARRLARYFEAAFDYYKDRGAQGSMHEFYGHCLDGLVRLDQLGGDARALDLAERIGSRAGRTHHTHHSLSMCRGMMDLHGVTGNDDYLRRTVDYLAWVRSARCVTGGVPESMPEYHEDEGCALADYVIVNLQVFAATGRDEFLEEAENTLVNHFFMNQFHTGGFGHRAFAQDVVGGKDWQGWDGKFGSENPGCCSFWGQWALGNASSYIATRSGDTIDFNLYPSAVIDFPDLGARIRIESDFPRMRQASFTISINRSREMDLSLRVPRWADGATVALNGVDISPRRVDHRMILRRKWRSGDQLDVRFSSSLGLVRWPIIDSPTAAVFDGPLCLALSNADANVDAAWGIETSANGKLALNPSGQPALTGGSGAAGIRLRPLGDDWLSPNVSTPHRLRVLFKTIVTSPQLDIGFGDGLVPAPQPIECANRL